MENSFYYFFSAVPQVLGGILALYGVFVIFKIQIFLDSLNKKASQLFNESRNVYNPEDSIEIRKLGAKIRRAIYDGINNKDMTIIKNALDSDKENTVNQTKSFVSFKEEFYSMYNAKEKIFNDTINYSILTAFIIIFCLSIIPFGKCLISYQNVLMVIFLAVIIAIIFSFYKLIKGLKTALQ